MTSQNKRAPLTSLNPLITKKLMEVPVMIFTRFLRDKVKKAGCELSKEDAEEIVGRILQNNETMISWPSKNGDLKTQEITITADDLEAVSHQIREFTVKELPKIIQKSAQDIAARTTKSLYENWPELKAYHEVTTADFRDDIETRWGSAFDILRMIHTICAEIGERYAPRWRRRSKRFGLLRFALLNLHVRACQVVAEIICLIENGYADGAIARWRTLHEIRVISSFIANQDNDLAKRYLDHAAVEVKRAKDRYVSFHEALGLSPPTNREIQNVENAYAKCLEEYGHQFGSEYGWAAKHLNHKKPRFADIEAYVGHAAMQPYYRAASYNVHATAKGLTFRLGLLDHENGAAIAGASNTGFSEPAYFAGRALIEVTTNFYGKNWHFGEQVEAEVLMTLSDHLRKALQSAQRRLERDHKRFISQKSSRSTHTVNKEKSNSTHRRRS